MNRFYVATALSFAALHSFAQTDSANHKALEEVVVTGQYLPQSAKNSVYQVRTISKERILKQGATKLQDLFTTELNIRFSQDLATGGSNITLMGLSGQNVKILVDGVPLSGRQGTSNEIDINQVDIHSIERIEIIEGPMSVIYGADALGGVINIITNKQVKDRLSVKARIHEETIGKEYGMEQGIHNQFAELSWRQSRWKLIGSVAKNYFGGWKGSSEGRELEWHEKEQALANFFVGYTGARWNIFYRAHGLTETITNPGLFVNEVALDQDYRSNRLMHQVQAVVDFHPRWSYQGAVSYSHYSREIYSTTFKTNGDRRLALGSGLQDLSTFNAIVARGTLLYKLSPKVSIQPGYDINSEKGKGQRLKEGNSQVNDYAFFVSSEITPVPSIQIRPGLRLAKNSVYDAPPMIPSLNTRFSLGKKMTMRLAYAKGFRAPSIRELYFDFFDASHQIEGNTNLKAETSDNFTGSLEWNAITKQNGSLVVSLNGFYNNIENLISVGQSETDATVFTYLNVAKYKTRGFNISNIFRYRQLEATLGAGYTGRYNEFSGTAGSTFNWSPEANGALSYTFRKAGLSCNLFYKYTGQLPTYQLVTIDDQQQGALVEVAGFHWADLTMNKKLFEHFTLNTGIRNLFNVTRINSAAMTGGPHGDGGARPIGYGRSVFAGILFNWAKKIGDTKPTF